VGKDGEMEVKEEYRGKIIYQDKDMEEHLAMCVMFKSMFTSLSFFTLLMQCLRQMNTKKCFSLGHFDYGA